VDDDERGMSAACERYWVEVIQPEALMAGRSRMASGLEDLYVRRLRLPDGRERAHALRDALVDAVLIEIGHDGQLPHLGVVRMVLKARSLAASIPSGHAIYLIGDHYSANMRPQNLHLGIPLRGVDSDHVKSPLILPVGPRRGHVPFHRLPPPEQSALDGLERRAEAWVAHNARHARNPSAARVVNARLREQFDLLRRSSALTTSFGDWLMRVQILWFDALYGGAPERLVVLPMTGIVEWLPDVLGEIAALGPIPGAAGMTRASGDDRSEERPSGSFWIYCRNCFRRHRATWEEGRFVGACSSCRTALEARWPEEAGWVMPDVVACEMALFRAGIAGWVVGSRADYIDAIRRGYRDRFQREMPPVFFLQSMPRFHGLGEPSDGHARARLFRVLLELDPREIRNALEAPWSADPVLRSSFL